MLNVARGFALEADRCGIVVFLCVCFYYYYFFISNDLHGKFCHLFPVNQKWTPPKIAMVLSGVLVHWG